MHRADSGNHWSQQIPTPILPNPVSHAWNPVLPGVVKYFSKQRGGPSGMWDLRYSPSSFPSASITVTLLK